MSCSGDCNSCPKASDCSQKQAQAACSPDKCATCPSKGKCGSAAAEPTEQNLRIAKSLSQFGHVLLILSGKGGVGKSTVATQLAFYLAEIKHKQVGLMDIDICGPSIPTMVGAVGAQVHGCADGWMPVGITDNLQALSIGFMLGSVDDAVIMRGPKKHATIAQFLSEVAWSVLEEESERSNNYLIIDTPPGTTDEHLSAINLIKQCSLLSDEAHRPKISSVIVSTPQEVALSDVMGVIENMSGFVCPCCNKETMIFHPTSGGCKHLCEEYNTVFLGKIPLDPLLSKAGEEGKPWSSVSEESVGLKQFAEIVTNILKQ